ncbi:hypothetical protein [Bacillus subtilis]|uniref:hypothetical protein n=1 Tax=Bacillus subtilis TaxID=1423 RepID=UPI001B90A914|nr:hypothetical protein [Bacillus subtilis]CAI6330871.1 hypothetical protein NRS6096_22145 [Bacillus subtilis]
MKVNFKKMLFQRYVLYPLFVGTITYLLLDFISATPMKNVMTQYSLYHTIEQIFGIKVSFEDGQLMYSYLVGYSYGTLSQITRYISNAVRIGCLTLLIILLQYYMCFYLFSTLSFFFIPLELTVLLFVFVFGYGSVKIFKRVKKA